MIGSTNHLERLDPGIAKRPSRFDRKYFYALPTHDERIKYCEYWRNKLTDNNDIDFPEKLSPEIANITKDFSFAYMKEAFVAALLHLVARKHDDEDDKESDISGGGELEKNRFWKEIQKQVQNLRDEIGSDDEEKGISLPERTNSTEARVAARKM